MNRNIIGSSNKKIEDIKYNLMRLYLKATVIVLLFYVLLFKFFIINNNVANYLVFGLLGTVILHSFSNLKKRLYRKVVIYLLIAPLYIGYILVSFWDNSISCFMLLITLIFLGYFFFRIKTLVLLIAYVVLVYIGCFFVNHYNLVDDVKYNISEVVFADTFLYVYVFFIMAMLFVYLDKIKTSSNNAVAIIPTKASKEKVKLEHKSIEINQDEARELITRLKELISREKLFKDPDLEISMISLKLGVNYSYLSKVIRYKGFDNFNQYINSYRVSYVKELLKETDLEKVTLLYIYTEAGFKNQSTFNRVFKQIEGVTPTEFIKNNNSFIN